MLQTLSCFEIGTFDSKNLSYLPFVCSIPYPVPFRGRKVLSGGDCNDPEITTQFKIFKTLF